MMGSAAEALGWSAAEVLELSGKRIAGWTSFLDAETRFPRFELPLALPA